MNLNHLKADYTIQYAPLHNPNLEVAIVRYNGKEIARVTVCKKCHQPVTELSGTYGHCKNFCLKQGCLCHAS